MTHPGVTRTWYQSFTDPAADAPYFTRLGEYLQTVSRPESDMRAFGLQPGSRFLHPITEFRCAAQVIANALTAEREGYDAFVIGHFQDAGLLEARAAVQIPSSASARPACSTPARSGERSAW